MTASVPSFLHKSGVALAGDERRGIAPLQGLRDNHVLVVVQMAGGNDGLNTLIPFADDRPILRQHCAGVPGGMLGIRLGQQAALTFAGERMRAATFVNPRMLNVPAEGAASRAMDRMAAVEPTGINALDFLQRTGNESRELSRRIRQAARDVRSTVDYPPFALCQSLKLVAQMIVAGVPTRVHYVTHGGFDTHAAQANRHAALLQELSQALALFRQDLRAHGQLDRVLLMTFSEFGRRIDENRQRGTDHGTANVMFLLGGKVRPGLHGAAPDLARRDPQGDLIFQTDFRSVYAGVLRDWLNANPARILQGDFNPMRLVAV